MSHEVREFARRLEAAFPAIDDPQLGRSLVRILARGEPVSGGDLAVIAGRPEAEVREALARWHNVRTDEHGRVIGFMGLSVEPTRHVFEVEGRKLFTWCAWDTLFLPAVLAATAIARSRCPVTDTDVRLVVTPSEIADAEPRRSTSPSPHRSPWSRRHRRLVVLPRALPGRRACGRAVERRATARRGAAARRRVRGRGDRRATA